MEGIKTIFQDAQLNSASLDLDEECSVITIYTAACNFIRRGNLNKCPYPSFENVLEAIIHDTDLEERLSSEPLVLADDIVPDLTGKISYRKFCAGMYRNKHLILSIYKPIVSKSLLEKRKLHESSKRKETGSKKDDIKRTKTKG
mmetsp:Transcript_32695/g.32060  ORF Transcript_32695/g.32060 Transcript_32695/m.32060 type:complete len:144 (-) Transcript_32695:4-435(-)